MDLFNILKRGVSLLRWACNIFPGQLETHHNSLQKKLKTWQRVNATCSSKDLNTRYWWSTAGRFLAIFLHDADYSAEAQYRHLSFFYSFVASELGHVADEDPAHCNWTSFMTDDGMPIEFSWDWGTEGELPRIRYAIEPIVFNASTSGDLFNKCHGIDLLHRLRSVIPGLNLQWFEHFANEFITFDTLPALNTEKYETTLFIAFDLNQTDVTAKAYFFPSLKAEKACQSKITTISEAIARLPSSSSNAYDFSALETLREYIHDPPANGSLEVEILSIDCVAPMKSRFKIYTRCRNTSFDSIMTVMTLNGRLETPGVLQGLEELKVLWHLLFSEVRSASDDLPQVLHRTAGILYYFELKSGKRLAAPKIYIPVRHYAQSDSIVLEALKMFLGDRRKEINKLDQYSRALRSTL